MIKYTAYKGMFGCQFYQFKIGKKYLVIMRQRGAKWYNIFKYTVSLI